MSSILDAIQGMGGNAAPAAPAAPDAAAAMPPGGDLGAPAPDAGGQGTPGQPDSADAEQALQDAVDALTQFLSVEQDDQDKAVASKALAQIQSIFGGRQKQHEAAAGITPAHKAMGRAMGGAGGANGY